MCFKPDGSSEDGFKRQSENSKQIDLQLKRDSVKFKNTIRVLLLGPGESGKSTFLKQMQILHMNGFSIEEKRKAIGVIHDNVHESIFVLVGNLSKLNVQLDGQMSIRSVDYILNIGEKRPDVIPLEYITHIKLLWRDAGIRRLYQQRNKFQLLDCAEYFLDKIDSIYSKSYVPSTEDMLHAREVTKTVNEINFTVNKGNHSFDILLIDVGGQREERSKWVQAFDGVKVVVYIAACSEFDQKLRENVAENRVTESLNLFRNVWENRYLRDAGMIIFLNKTDLLEQKIQQGKRINQYFGDFVQFDKNPCCKRLKKTRCVLENTKEYIKHKFKEIAVPFTLHGPVKGEKIEVERECTLHFTTATNTENIRKVFSDCEHIILYQNFIKFKSS